LSLEWRKNAINLSILSLKNNLQQIEIYSLKKIIRVPLNKKKKLRKRKKVKLNLELNWNNLKRN